MRNRFLWMFAAIMMCGAVMTGLTSCTSDDDSKGGGEDDKERVAILLPDGVNLARWATDRANLKSVIESYGYTPLVYVAPESAEGAKRQVEQLRTAIHDGVKYIVLTAIDYKMINESGLLERHPDVKVVCHDRFILNNPRISYISSADTREIGRMQAQFLLNHYHSKGVATMTVEILEGPLTDVNAKDYYDGAMDLLRKYIDDEKLIVKSGKTSYSEVRADSWSVADGKKAMQDRLASYGAGERPDMVLAAVDNQAQGAIEALEEAGITLDKMPVITGQDNTATAEANIKAHKQTMTIDKNLKDMAYNTAMIVNGLISGSPVLAGDVVSGIPVLYSKTTLMTIDSYSY